MDPDEQRKMRTKYLSFLKRKFGRGAFVDDTQGPTRRSSPPPPPRKHSDYERASTPQYCNLTCVTVHEKQMQHCPTKTVWRTVAPPLSPKVRRAAAASSPREQRQTFRCFPKTVSNTGNAIVSNNSSNVRDSSGNSSRSRNNAPWTCKNPLRDAIIFDSLDLSPISPIKMPPPLDASDKAEMLELGQSRKKRSGTATLSSRDSSAQSESRVLRSELRLLRSKTARRRAAHHETPRSLPARILDRRQQTTMMRHRPRMKRKDMRCRFLPPVRRPPVAVDAPVVERMKDDKTDCGEKKALLKVSWSLHQNESSTPESGEASVERFELQQQDRRMGVWTTPWIHSEMGASSVMRDAISRPCRCFVRSSPLLVSVPASTPGRVQFRVRAGNGNGWGKWSRPSKPVRVGPAAVKTVVPKPSNKSCPPRQNSSGSLPRLGGRRVNRSNRGALYVEHFRRRRLPAMRPTPKMRGDVRDHQRGIDAVAQSLQRLNIRLTSKYPLRSNSPRRTTSQRGKAEAGALQESVTSKIASVMKSIGRIDSVLRSPRHQKFLKSRRPTDVQQKLEARYAQTACGAEEEDGGLESSNLAHRALLPSHSFPRDDDAGEAAFSFLLSSLERPTTNAQESDGRVCIANRDLLNRL